MTISVHRVYWFTDWVREVKFAIRELWRAVWGCGWFRRHDWVTTKFRHISCGDIHGRRWQNVCQKCGAVEDNTSWHRPVDEEAG